MAKPIPITEFMAMFPDDDACLEHLFKQRFGKDHECSRCGEVGNWKKLSGMPAYTCQCGNHVHPMVGTPFHKSHTPLQKWFYAMYLFTTTRHGVPAKELQRQLSVNYKTAWRMGHEIRKYLGLVDGDRPLSGHVEVDETYVGGVQKKARGRPARGAKGKTPVLGILERGGDVIARVVEDAKSGSLIPPIVKNVEPGTTVSTDEWAPYKFLGPIGYKHGTVNHGREEWVRGIHHTQGIEGFWSLLKRSIKGTHVHVLLLHVQDP